jgi:hypothetical protein
MEEESHLLLAFAAVCLVLGAVLVLFYYKGQPNSKGKRALAFVVLLGGEALLFPWSSPVDWLKMAVIATVNYVLGADHITLDGVHDALRDFFHETPPSGGASSGIQPSAPGISLPPEDNALVDPSRTSSEWPLPELSLLNVLRRLLWPDLPRR